jgi:hypothetical protein
MSLIKLFLTGNTSACHFRTSWNLPLLIQEKSLSGLSIPVREEFNEYPRIPDR